MQKVHRSAVCLVPPRSVWAQVQEVRVFRDKSFARWMPHINLLYPFHEDTGDAFEAAAACCAEALRGFSPFQVGRLGPRVKLCCWCCCGCCCCWSYCSYCC